MIRLLSGLIRVDSTIGKNNRDSNAAKKLALTWSPWIQLKQKPNRLDVKADISGFAKSCMRKIK